jgi:peptidase E
MTKYILVGGYPHKAKDKGKALCEESIAGLNEPIKILICLFARDKKQWTKLFKENQQFFIKNLPAKKLEFILANEKNLIKQIQSSNLINFNGGDTTILIKMLDKFPEWTKKLKNKNIMGSSAGADILSKYNYDIEFFKCSNGYGLIPIKTIVHFKSAKYTPPIGWNKAYEKLKNYKEDLPIWALSEGEFKTIVV